MSEIGIIGAAPVRVVGPAGTLAELGPVVGDAAPPIFFDWWVGADDRWHHASSEAAVRQDIDPAGCAPRTRLRIPGGDAVAQVAAVPAGGSGVVLVEIHNDSPVPVALALVHQGPPGSVDVQDRVVSVDGRPVLHAARSIARVTVADDVAAARAVVEAGAALPPAEQVWPVPGAVVVAILPLAHAATLRVTLGGTLTHAADPDLLPPLEAVARGWTAHLDAGAEITIPDERLMRALDAARRHLLVGSGSARSAFWTVGVEPWVPAVAAVALQAWGHEIEARELLLAASGPDDLLAHASRGAAEAGAVLWAWAELLERRPDPDLHRALAPWIEDVAVGLMRGRRRFGRRRVAGPEDTWRAVGLAAAGSLLSRAGDQRVGPDIVDALPALVGEVTDTSSLAIALAGTRMGRAPGRLLDHLGATGSDPTGLAAVASSADATGAIAGPSRSQDPALSALLLLAARRAVVDEPAGTGGPVALLTGLDPTWYGSALEGHRIPVTGGTLSFGVRWHGARPALLWDVDASVAAMEITAPALDPTWTDTRPRGEALLAPTPGLVLEAGPTSAEVRRGERLDTGDDPGSFD